MDLPARFGKYELIEHLATGGMAEVFLARSFGAEGFEKRLVIKRILPGLADNPRFVSMFVKEAKISAGLRHPNIVQIFELGKVGDDPYIAMEHIHGHDLTRLMRQLRKREERMPVPLALYAVASLLRGLAHAHAATDSDGAPLNLVHRDISPHNVLVSFQGEVKLFDFGIARLVGEATRPTAGQPGGGKFAYMSPEQARGERVDRRSDLFSAGVVLYELLVGHKLYRGDDAAEKLARVQRGVVPDPRPLNPHITDPLWAALSRLLAGSPDARPASAEEAEEELWAVLYGMGERADASTMSAFMRAVCGAEQALGGVVDLAGLARDLRRLEGDLSNPTRSEADRSISTLADAAPPVDSGLDRRPRLPPGERKSVVVVTAEVVGLTDLSANFDPAQVVRGHLRFLRRARRAVGRFGGHLDSWQDDTLVVLFGVPRAHELDLERALACALELVRLAAGMERHGLKMGLCVGVHRGAITVGARHNRRGLRYLPMGDTTKLARWLCYEADVGEVLVSDEAARLAHEAYAFQPGPALKVKGRRTATSSARLLGRRRRAEGPRGAWLPRQGELDQVRDALEHLRDGGSGLLVVDGPPGTGKTRLVRELRARARARGVPMFIGRSVPYGSHGPGGVFKDLVADIIGLDGREPPGEVRERVERLSQLGLTDADVRVVGALFAIEPGDRPVLGAGASLPRVARRVVLGLAAAQPIIVALEDTQHLSEDEIDLLANVIDGTREAPVLFLVTARDGAPPALGTPDWRVCLQALDREQQHELVLSLLPEALGPARVVSEALLDVLDARAHGNPLYVEAMVDALARDARITVHAGEARLVDPDRAVQLPSGLDGLIAARVDSLPPALKEALQLAAIIGTELQTELLAASLRLDDPDAVVTSLVDGGLLARDEEVSGRLQFANLFVWEAVRTSTLDARRRDLHALVAEGLRALAKGSLDTVREPLARHCAGAGAFVEAAEHIERAGDLLHRQQLMAEAGTCWDKAVGWLGAARRSGSRPSIPVDREARIRIKAGAAWSVAGAPARAEMHLQVALDLVDEGAGRSVEAEAQLELGRLYRSQARIQLARLHLELALQAAQGSIGQADWARPVAVGALEGLGMLGYDCGENDAAVEHFRQAVALAEGHPRLHAGALHGLALRYVREGQEARALSMLEAARSEAQGAEDRILVGRIVNNVGIVHHGAGRYREALDCFRESMGIREGLGYHNGVAINLHNIGDAWLRLGDRGRAWAAFHKSRDLCATSRWDRGVAMNEVFLAWLEVEEADEAVSWATAFGRLESATARARELADPDTALTGAWLQGRALAAHGDGAAAHVVLADALAEAHELDAGPLVRDLERCLEGVAGGA